MREIPEDQIPEDLAEGQEVAFTDRFKTCIGIIKSIEVFKQPDDERVVWMCVRVHSIEV